MTIRRPHLIVLVAALAAGAPDAAGQRVRRFAAVEIPAAPADSTALLQSCVDRGQTIPEGTYPFAGQVVVPWGRSLVGAGPTRCVLQYTGPPRPDGCLSIPAGSWGYTLRGFALVDPAKRKAGCGIRGGATPQQFGTQSGFARIDDLWVDGFAFGLRFGDKALNTSSSELTVTNLRLSDCDVGCRLETWNTLDVTFLQIGLAGCRVGIETDQAGCVHILGGSASNVSETVWSITGAGTYSIRNLRTENCGSDNKPGVGALLTQNFALPRFSVTVDSCETNGATRKDRVDVLLKGGGSLAMRGGTYVGHVGYEGFGTEPKEGYGSINLDGVGCRDKVLLTSAGKTQARYTIRGCDLLDANNQILTRVDAAGVLGTTARIPTK